MKTKLIVTLIASMLVTTPVYADVKVVAEPTYSGDVQNIASTIKTHVPKQTQDALENLGGFVWIKPITGLSNLENNVITVNPTVNPNVTRLSTMQEFGHFTRTINNVDTSALGVELSRYQALWKELDYGIPEIYTTDALYDTVFAAYCLHDLEPAAGSILNTCPKTLSLIDENIKSTTTTVSIPVGTKYELQESKETTKLPTVITWGD